MSTKISVTSVTDNAAQDEAVNENLSPVERLLTWRPFSTVARTVIILGLVVPLLFAGLFMWAMWDPTGAVPNTRLAVVNNDRGVDRGQGAGKEEFGANVVEGLASRDYLNFSEVSDEEAREGLMKGKYLFTVTIPEDFSANVVTVIDPQPKQANILIDFNDYNGTNGAVLTSGLVPQIQSEVSAEVAKTYAEQVLGGINELGDGLRAAADGSQQLDEGVGQLQEGTGRAAEGIGRLDDGANQLHDGTGRLVDGTDRLQEGTGRLVDGTVRLGDGANQLNDGAYQLKDGLDQLENGTDQLADGAGQIDAGVDKLTGMLIPLLEQAQGSVNDLRPIVDVLRSVGLHAEADKISTIITQLDPGNPLNVVNDLNRLRDGTDQLYANLSDPALPYRSGIDQLQDGAGRLADGTDRLQHGVSELSDGAGQLSDGANQLSDGAGQLRDGTTRLTHGTSQLVDGSAQLEDGVGRLKDGSSELSTKLGDGAARAPKVEEMNKSAQQIAVPIVFEEANLHPTQVIVDPADPTEKEPSSGFSLLGLIVINFLLMAVTSILLPHAIGRRQHARGSLVPVLSAWLTNFGINLALTALLTFVSITLGWRPSNWLVMTFAVLLIDAAGTSIFQFFRILFGRVIGALFNVGFFALGLFVSGAVWPLSTLPAPLAIMNPLHPMSYAKNLFVRSVDGMYDSSFWTAIAILLVFTTASVAASTMIYDARRKALHIQDPNENERQRADIAHKAHQAREGEEPIESVFTRA